MSELTDAKRRIIEALKRADDCTAQELADQFSTTTTAVRQHLEALQQSGLVERFEGTNVGRGRPALHWRTTALARELFPDRHSELTVDLVESIRATLGNDALDHVINHRSAQQLAAYQAALPSGSTELRVRALGEQRTAEGYLAEVVHRGNDLLLIEHHCPICSAATACQGLCRSELEVFQAALGASVTVTREEHLLSGDARCAYRISDNSSPV
ncbi:MAG: helix-turn-helix domain-containing protein [Actinomycetota bacterium]|jgi:predicted ArsR family transcriptional regulator